MRTLQKKSGETRPTACAAGEIQCRSSVTRREGAERDQADAAYGLRRTTENENQKQQ